MTNRPEHASWKGRYKRASMKRYKADTESIKVGLFAVDCGGALSDVPCPGTWVPLQEGRLLAERNGVLGKLLPLFDYIPGTISPPQAPKHHTAASNKNPKVPKPSKAQRNSQGTLGVLRSLWVIY